MIFDATCKNKTTTSIQRNIERIYSENPSFDGKSLKNEECDENAVEEAQECINVCGWQYDV